MKNGGFFGRSAKYLGLIFTFIIAASSFGQTPPDAKAILVKVADGYKAMTSFRFDGLCTMEFGTGSSSQKIEIPLLSAAVIADNKMRFEAKNTFMGGLTACDGRTIWKYSAILGQYTKQPIPPSSRHGERSLLTPPDSLGAVLYRWRILEGLQGAKYLGEEALEFDGQKTLCDIVEAVYAPDPKSKDDGETDPHKFWIDKVRGLVLKEAMAGKMRFDPEAAAVPASITVTLTAAKIDVALPDEIFVFTPPKGVQEASPTLFGPTMMRRSPLPHQDAKDLLETVARRYQSLRSYHFQGRMTMEGKGVNFHQAFEFLLTAAAVPPDHFRFEASQKFPILATTFVSDGQSTWRYLPRYQEYRKRAEVPTSLAIEEGSDAVFLSNVAVREHLFADYAGITRRLKDARFLEEEILAFEGVQVRCQKVEAFYNPDPQYQNWQGNVSKIFWIDRIRNLILKDVLNGEIRPSPDFGPFRDYALTTTLTSAKVDVPLPEDLFVFTPPEGAKEAGTMAWEDWDVAWGEWATSHFLFQPAQAFILRDLEGNEIDFKAFQGKAVLLDFWTSLAKPCRADLLVIEKLCRELKDKNLIVWGINGEDPAITRTFCRELRLSFPTLHDVGQDVARRYRVVAAPTIFIIDSTGKISSHLVGARSERELREALSKAGIR